MKSPDLRASVSAGARCIPRLLALCVLLLAVASPARAVTFVWNDVVDAGNAADPLTGYGSVGYEYRINSTEVTNAEYTEFLNAIAATDTNSVWNSSMDITRSGASGSYTYTAVGGLENHAVNVVTLVSAMRFVNWIENGQLTGAQDLTTTEDGTYFMPGGNGLTETRDPGATYFLPNENEWYKAAYYDPTPGAGGGDNYWLYPTQSDAIATTDANYNNVVGDTTVVGSYTPTSYYGGYDFGGNVFEWTETVDGTGRIIRGGDYINPETQLRSTSRTALDPLGGSDPAGVGFRIAGLIDAPEDSSDPFDFDAIPEPSRAVLLLLGVLSMLLRRRR